MTRPAFITACVLAAAPAFAGAAGPADGPPAGRERPPADHEFYRPAVAAPAAVVAWPAAAPGPSVDVAGWLQTVRDFLLGVGRP